MFYVQSTLTAALGALDSPKKHLKNGRRRADGHRCITQGRQRKTGQMSPVFLHALSSIRGVSIGRRFHPPPSPTGLGRFFLAHAGVSDPPATHELGLAFGHTLRLRLSYHDNLRKIKQGN